jgi:hypothetical protein
MWHSLAMDDTYEDFMHMLWEGAPKEQRKFLETAAPRAARRGNATVRWVAEFQDCTNQLADPARQPLWPYVGMFWVRLQEIVRALPSAYALAGQLVKEPVRQRTVVYRAAAVAEAASRVGTALSENELIAIDYLRQLNGHLHQDKYEVRWNTKTNTSDGLRGFPQLKKEVPVEDALSRVQGVLQEHGGEVGAAVILARRLKPHADALMAAVDELYSMRSEDWDT